MECKGSPFARIFANAHKTPNQQIHDIWARGLECRCDNCTARIVLEARRFPGSTVTTLGNYLVKTDSPPRRGPRPSIETAVTALARRIDQWRAIALELEPLLTDKNQSDIVTQVVMNHPFSRPEYSNGQAYRMLHDLVDAYTVCFDHMHGPRSRFADSVIAETKRAKEESKQQLAAWHQYLRSTTRHSGT